MMNSHPLINSYHSNDPTPYFQKNESGSSPTVKKKYRKVVASAANPGDDHPEICKSAKSKLYEICASRHWKPPSFDCCVAHGPTHNMQFSYKVTVVVEESVPRKAAVVIECFGELRSAKKKAAEHAAEGALWYMKNLGYACKD